LPKLGTLSLFRRGSRPASPPLPSRRGRGLGGGGLCGSPAEIIAAAEALLAQGRPVVVDASGYRALLKALGVGPEDDGRLVLSPSGGSGFGEVVLRIRDVLAAGLGLVALSPLFGVLALLIKRSSPGPVLYATAVVGKDGRTFTWHKFRSMRVGTAADDARRREQYRAYVEGAGGGGAGKLLDESRVTGVGRFIRRHSIDELPQLWNVLCGEMTLVGPRPCLPYEYELQAPWQRLRYRVTPGLTGPWQAYGRSKVTVDEMALMDYCYGYRRSFWLDVRLMLRTIGVVINGDGGR
jgi:lipopolysaccharide/colanic/teichoic acid biosynthesis glycosyltransferase